jgi:hypothetical protein
VLIQLEGKEFKNESISAAFMVAELKILSSMMLLALNVALPRAGNNMAAANPRLKAINETFVRYFMVAPQAAEDRPRLWSGRLAKRLL